MLIYLILVLTFGYSIMTLEIAIGRKTGLSPVGAFRKFSQKYTWVGWLTVIISTIILGYYSIIGGWVIKYLVTFITNSGPFAAADGYFNNFISQPYQPILYGVIFSLAGLGAVSYTHLDVYKRQQLTSIMFVIVCNQKTKEYFFTNSLLGPKFLQFIQQKEENSVPDVNIMVDEVYVNRYKKQFFDEYIKIMDNNN